MLQNKNNKIFSEINEFFNSNDKAISKTMSVFKTLQISKVMIDAKSNWPEQYSRQNLLLALLLQPLFSVQNISDYLQSTLFEYIHAAKDTLYRFKNEGTISWRKIVDQVNQRIIRRIEQSGTKDSDSPTCLILDDTDLKKTGKHIEHISRIWSHVAHGSILGFKGLFLGYWDSKTFIGLDFSLHKEKGKNKKYPNGISKRDNKKQYKKTRVRQDADYQRQSELFVDKISNAIMLIKKAVSQNIKFEYVLMDSWFVCEQIILEVIQTGAQMIGMCKMGNAKYTYQNKQKSAKQILRHLKQNKNVRWYKQLHLFVTETTVIYKDIPVKLFFCRNSKRGKWHLLITTDTKLNIKRTYEIYSIRWSIEVFFKEAKQYFQLGKSQSRDFNAQIADTSISMIQYNIFSLAKRFSTYETLGELFNDAKNSTMELTICKRLWAFFLEFIALIADMVNVDPDELMGKILKEDAENKFIKLVQLNAA